MKMLWQRAPKTLHEERKMKPTWSQAKRSIDNCLKALNIEPSLKAVCDASNNSPETVAKGELWLEFRNPEPPKVVLDMPNGNVFLEFDHDKDATALDRIEASKLRHHIGESIRKSLEVDYFGDKKKN